jgi:hypothetical protein
MEHTRRNEMYDFEEINAILNQMADEGIVEPMVEPIDEQDCHPMDFADVTGLFDEMYPEPEMMVDENGTVWYVG